MEEHVVSHPLPAPGDALSGDGSALELLRRASGVDSSELPLVVQAAGDVLGAVTARLLVADYGLTSLLELGRHGPTEAGHPIDGTIAGRAFINGEVVVSSAGVVTVWAPVAEGSERLGVLELTFATWSDDLLVRIAGVIRVLVLEIISKRRYTDTMLRSRRSQPLTLAAEMQWDLLPPLTTATEHVSVSGILEPAYEIGGDSFDYAVNPEHLEFAIVDAVGHGMSAVLMAVATINSLRNSRREGHGLERAYRSCGSIVESHFGQSYFVTGQAGSLDLDTGQLTWINAGHPRPLLVRDGSFVGELECHPSLPFGLGGDLREISVERLQAGDRVLFFTDGVIESRSETGEQFGLDRLADQLVQSTLGRLSSAETVRRLSASVMGYNPAGVEDDATLLLIHYHG